MIDPSVTNIVNAASGVLFVGLGLFVASVRRTEAANRGFAAFAIGLGVYLVLLNLWSDGTTAAGNPLARGLEGIALAVAVAGTVGLARAAPAPRSGDDRRRVLVASGVALFLPSIVIALDLASRALGQTNLTTNDFMQPRLAVPFVAEVALYALLGAMAGVIVLFALRYPAFRPRSPERARLALMASALSLYPAYYIGSNIGPGFPWDPWAVPWALVTFLFGVFAMAIAWLHALARSGDRAARNVAWLALGTLTIGTLVGRLTGADNAGYGVARTLGFLILGYAILKHQLLGIDVRVRWTIRASTLAAVFVGVFFMVSELAQEVFSSSTGSSYMGIAAAGALLFALAPLQRVAERVANAAVPGGATRAPGGRAAATYQAMVRRLLQDDGRLSPDDERTLAHLAQELGIGAGDAMELRLAAVAGPRR